MRAAHARSMASAHAAVRAAGWRSDDERPAVPRSRRAGDGDSGQRFTGGALRARPGATRQRASEEGFTLLEILVAMTLFTLLVATAYAGLRIGARSVEATDARAGTADELAMVTRLLEQYLSSAQPVLTRQDVRSGRRPSIEFDGRPDGVSFLAEMPARIGYGGLYRITLRLVDNGPDGTDLEFERLLFGVEPRDDLDSAAATQRTLLRGLAGGYFEYFGARERRDEPQWTSEWQDARLPPLAVRAVFEDPNRAWPELIVPLRLQALRSVRGSSTGGDEGGEEEDEAPEQDDFEREERVVDEGDGRELRE